MTRPIVQVFGTGGVLFFFVALIAIVGFLFYTWIRHQ